MLLRCPLVFVSLTLTFFQFATGMGAAQAPARLCNPALSSAVVVATPAQRLAAGAKAEPPLTDSFDWPDTPLGVIKTANGYEFFGSDGGAHYRQMWHGHWVGNNKSGSFTTTVGTLDDPLGSGNPEDVSVSPNPNAVVNPIYPSYGYMGGGPVYQVPAGMTGAGNLLATYHAELPNDALYAALGLAASSDNGLHWTDLGEIIRLNQAYAVGLDGFEIGDGPLVLSPDGKYFYLYFPDWIANGTLHTTNGQGVSTTTNVSVARALAVDVLDAAFGSLSGSSSEHPSPRHSIAFQKFYEGSWVLQPAIGGASTDLIPHAPFSGYLDIHYSNWLKRYSMIVSDDTNFAYAESVDGLNWTLPVSLGTFGPIAAYPTAVGLGDDPRILGKSYYVYYTHLPADGDGWTEGALRRLTVTCQ
jgi:hypothetical protein